MTDTPCIQCSQPTGSPPRLNHLPNGLPCPACRDRLLESLPAIVPGELDPEEVEEPTRGFEPRYLAGDSEWAPEDADPA